MHAFLQIALPLYLILFFGAVFVWRTYRVWKQTGVNPYKLPKVDDAYGQIGKAMSFTWGLCVLVVLIHSFSEPIYSYLTPINWLDAAPLAGTGLAVLTLSLAWTIRAQGQMGRAWRIGIDKDQPAALVTAGIFGRSRNPIFLGMLGMLLGLMLCLPNAFSLLACGLGFVLLQMQVRLEEAHLINVHGAAYQDYSRRVPRWI
jgi:protein-S-isoprenylcysteine O-methyltransferase Ste14